ncbi:MAG: NrfD/PsrC family molybdoenzyme membrane anchor subunit [Candidatus Hodarchaeales archaeon]|jgi:molybdopterin-containing oxidoreductase family membrane subunit
MDYETALKQKRYQNVLESMKITPKFLLLMVSLLIVIFIGLWQLLIQFDIGLGVTGMHDRVIYGLYITNFVFWIGVSHAGMFITGILRVTNVEWRAPVTRLAESITIFALTVGAINIFVDMGRLDRIFNVIWFGRFQSPIFWDFLSISTYFVGSLFFLYLALVPDLAILRDRTKQQSKFRHNLYRLLAGNYKGTPVQEKFLNKALTLLPFIIIPVAVSVHTVVSWIFSMTWRPGWFSTVFGPYFLVGAIYSGIAAVILVMYVFQRYYHLEEFLTDQHFVKLSKLLIIFAMLYFYFSVSEYLTIAFTHHTEEWELLLSLFYGDYAWAFWFFWFPGLIIPGLILINPKTRTKNWIIFATILINIGMWLKRYFIIIPTLSMPIVSGEEWAWYIPTFAEIAITAAGFALFIFLYALFTKIFPIISMWEMIEYEEKENMGNLPGSGERMTPSEETPAVGD